MSNLTMSLQLFFSFQNVDRSVCYLLQSLNGAQTIKTALIQNSSNHFVQLNLKSTLNNIDNHSINTTARSYTYRSE